MRAWTWLVAALVLLVALPAGAAVDPRCLGLPKPADYNEQVQQDFLSNHLGLTTTFSPIHGPIPHEAGRGAIGVELSIVPPLSCRRRFVLDWSKTEETNQLPLLPRLRASFAFPEVFGITFYAGVGYVPPLTIAGLRGVVVSGEFGFGLPIPNREEITVGARFHTSMVKVTADIATAFDPRDEDILDLYVGSTFGLDAMAGYTVGVVTPYASLGFTDVSTFFYVGDDGVVTSNLHPYFGPVFSVGVDVLIIDAIRLGGEFYGAPFGHSKPGNVVGRVETVPGLGRYGHTYTGRFRLGWEL